MVEVEHALHHRALWVHLPVIEFERYGFVLLHVETPVHKGFSARLPQRFGIDAITRVDHHPYLYPRSSAEQRVDRDVKMARDARLLLRKRGISRWIRKTLRDAFYHASLWKRRRTDASDDVVRRIRFWERGIMEFES